MQPMLTIAVRAARQAGNIIVRAIERLDTIKMTPKQGYDFVTEIDQQAEHAIIQILRKTYPDHAIFAEESGFSAGSSEYEWLIDPLDGTTNFIHGLPHYAVSIAVKHKDRLEHAVIYDPLRQELFTASRGKGAQLNNRRIRVSAHKTLEGSLLSGGFPIHQPQWLKAYLEVFQAVAPLTSGFRRGGSAALDLAYIAAGRLDGFWDFRLQPWDIAAGILLIKEAGGLVTDITGHENYFDTGHIIAANPKICKNLLQLMQSLPNH